ncbi:hypothetical protein MXB_2337 [Myxobolus squamalis]|nr:hypothetical protein MXB_2337 [Myxobolus squamalis]
MSIFNIFIKNCFCFSFRISKKYWSFLNLRIGEESLMISLFHQELTTIPLIFTFQVSSMHILHLVMSFLTYVFVCSLSLGYNHM